MLYRHLLKYQIGRKIMHGDIVYIELACTSKETLRFYEKIFRWKVKESFITSHKYFMFETPGKSLKGGFDTLIKPSTKGPQIYIEVDDIERVTTEMMTDFDSAVVLKDKTLISEDYGYYALILDPSGNKVGLQENIKKED